ncbi:DUF6655 family protein [Planctomycetaceae bacterium SH139]
MNKLVLPETPHHLGRERVVRWRLAVGGAIVGAVRGGEPRRFMWRGLLLVVFASIAGGCGTTKSFEATEQLLLSDAVDDSIAAIDFRPLGGNKVFLDTQYIKTVKGPGFVNADYVTSALRQQVLAAGCLLQDSAEAADIIIEARVGTLGSDSFQVTYGIPANSALSSAAQALPTLPPIPVLPELSLARREAREGAAKVAAFAYHRETRQPIWQSGVARSSTTARDTYIMGVGPLQSGSVRGKTRLIGAGFEFGETTVEGATPSSMFERPPVNYNAQVRYQNGVPILGPRLAEQSTPTADTPAESDIKPAAEPAVRVAEKPEQP